MLVLTRRIGEEIVIAGKIRLTVLKVNGDKVRLGISAPPTVSVLRQELLTNDTESNATPTLAVNPKESDTRRSTHES